MLRGIAAYVRRHHIALLALFFALGGTAVAASNVLPRNSVGSAQVINGSLQKKDLAGKAVKALRGNKGVRGIPGAAGPQGIQGIQGIQGVPGPFTDTLPAGQTLRGNYMLSQTNAAASNFHNAVSFGFRLSAAPTVHYINNGTTPPAQCPGTVTNPQAAPGNLCIYEVEATNVTGRGACNPEVGGCPSNSASREGFAVYGGAAGAGSVYMFGSWAVTAPAAAAALTPAAPQSHGAATIG